MEINVNQIFILEIFYTFHSLKKLLSYIWIILVSLRL